MSRTIEVNFPVPPQAVMPEALQTAFLWLTVVAVAATVVAAIIMCRKYRSVVPIMMVFAGFAAILLEPIVTFLGHAIHPASGQIMLFDTVDRAIPWHIALGYTAGFGVFYLILYPKMLTGCVSSALIWKMCAITAVCFFLGEAIPVSNGLWIYYDYQPLWLWHGTAPLTWNVLDTCCILGGAALMHVALPYLHGWKQILIVPLGPMGALMGHTGAGFPMFNAMNSSLPHWAIQLSGVATVLMALLMIWICTIVMSGRPHRSD